MDPSSVKHYHLHECDAKTYLNTYFSPTSDKQLLDEIAIFPMKELQKLKTTGDTLIDFSVGPNIFQLLSICEDFKEFIVLEAHLSCSKELEKWVNNEKDAFNWSHLPESFPKLGIDRKKWLEKEEILRKKVKYIKMFNLDKKHLTDPFELEKADCLLSLYLLQNICKDKDSFCKILKTCSSYIKVGGYLILIGTFNGEYFIIGDHKFHILNYDEEFLRKAVAEAGFTIDHLQIFEKTAVTDSIKYGNMYCLRALKEREV